MFTTRCLSPYTPYRAHMSPENTIRINWGVPEQAPHRCVEHDPCLSVCMCTSYRKYTLVQIADPDFARDCMHHVKHNVLVQWTWRTQSTCRTTPQTTPLLPDPTGHTESNSTFNTVNCERNTKPRTSLNITESVHMDTCTIYLRWQSE